MSGFSAEWLRLREPVDHRSRDAGLADQLKQYLGGHKSVRLLDLGCGAGSNLRALAPLLPAKQHWRLIDYDQPLLDEARRRIDAWIEESGLTDLSFRLEAADLETDLERLFSQDYDVITAAAFFDLVSKGWIDRLAALIVEHRCAFYTVLIYDGAMSWEPPHHADEAIRAAFNSHQHQDKGFGPAAGPDAARHLAERFGRAGYRVMTASSPWRMTRETLPLMLATADGIGEAARETCLVCDQDVTGWLETRRALERCEIGHVDLLALPQ